MLNSTRYRIGHWTFVPSAHELRSGATRVRLQQRASATLSLLCERAGDVVSRQEIIDRAWGRQHLSENSVAIVIGDLRRALGLDSGEPGSIETLPKAGYRLTHSAESATAPPRPARRPLAIGAALAALLVAAAATLIMTPPPRPEVALGKIENATGSGGYAPLMQACRETVLVELGRHSSEFSVVETSPTPAKSADYVLQQRWVLWSGQPELVLVARDRAGATVWSGAIYGSEDQFPAKISDQVAHFAAFARTRGARF